MEQVEAVEGGDNRRPDGTFGPGNKANLAGRPPDTEADKIKKKAIKELTDEYRQNLAEALPQISPVLIRQAVKGDISAIREVNDRVMGKPQQDITSGGEKLPTPILINVPSNESGQEDPSPQAEN